MSDVDYKKLYEELKAQNRMRFEPPPETVQGVARELIVGTFKLANRILLILDIDRTVNLEHIQEQAAN